MKKLINLIKKILKNKDSRQVLLAFIFLTAILLGYLFYLSTANRVSIENSIISTPITSISPDAPGKIIDSYVVNGNMVKKGDILALVGTQTLKAYTDGLIISVNNAKGSIASAQTPVVQMIDLNSMRVDGTIDENKGLDKIKVGQVASFTIDAFPRKTFWGYVDEISPSAKQTQLAFSISSERPTQQFDVFVRFNAYAYPEIKNGMSSKITIYTR
jgi:multidrug resistance efflux pump